MADDMNESSFVEKSMKVLLKSGHLALSLCALKLSEASTSIACWRWVVQVTTKDSAGATLGSSRDFGEEPRAGIGHQRLVESTTAPWAL